MIWRDPILRTFQDIVTYENERMAANPEPYTLPIITGISIDSTEDESRAAVFFGIFDDGTCYLVKRKK